MAMHKISQISLKMKKQHTKDLVNYSLHKAQIHLLQIVMILSNAFVKESTLMTKIYAWFIYERNAKQAKKIQMIKGKQQIPQIVSTA